MTKPLLLGALLTFAVAMATLLPLAIIGADPDLMAVVAVLDLCAAGLIGGKVAEHLPPPEGGVPNTSSQDRIDAITQMGVLGNQAITQSMPDNSGSR
jgi:hypothetical protein